MTPRDRHFAALARFRRIPPNHGHAFALAGFTIYSNGICRNDREADALEATIARAESAGEVCRGCGRIREDHSSLLGPVKDPARPWDRVPQCPVPDEERGTRGLFEVDRFFEGEAGEAAA